jgi:hypothetical protein
MAAIDAHGHAAVTASMPATELGRALSNAVLALSKRPYPPVLGAVHITWQAGILQLTATDQRILICESLELIESNGTGRLLLPGQETRKLIKVVETNPDTGPATLHLNGDLLTVTTDSTTTRIHLPPDPGGYPDTQPWVPDWADAGRSFSQVALHPDYLARLARLRPDKPGAPLLLQLGHGAHKPVAFRMGNRLAGVVMPVQLTS